MENEKVLGANRYRVLKLGAKVGRCALHRWLQCSGRPQPNGAGIVEQMTEEDLTYFCDLFAPQTQVQVGEAWPFLNVIFDEHFTKDYREMYQWLDFCFQVNFSSFFLVRSGSPSGTPPKTA